jgi:hypothetical protein
MHNSCPFPSNRYILYYDDSDHGVSFQRGNKVGGSPENSQGLVGNQQIRVTIKIQTRGDPRAMVKWMGCDTQKNVLGEADVDMKSPEEQPPPVFHDVGVEGALIRGLPVRAESPPTPLRHFNSQI